ncbi:MAG: aminotransferase class I/II-fold pyridoxal phosphate-dependent enzyme [Candidatus Eiseniibacteriota bacterium]|nr:MAG: aminotransferase class I/II-fold pyridoxal phosphate-dependent enzyme [Candidatus Eisenbacteria bacterium]
MKERKLGFATIAVHGKKRLDKHETQIPIRALSTPIFQSSTFAFESAEQGAAIFAGEQEGYYYTRLGNPTQTALENEMAFLEGGEAGLATASGMAATATLIISLARSGEKVVASDTLYGGTHQLFVNTFPRLNIEVQEVDASDPQNIERAIDERTRLVFIETPANPTLKLVDIEAVASITRKQGVALVVDNTFCTPYYQNPLELGADYSLHSATKYIGGHGDTVAGIIVGPADGIKQLKKEFLRDLGGVISPFNAWLLLRGLKTLPVRMEKHSENAMEIAQFLSFHPKVSRVWFPWLRTHPQYELAKRQMRGPGGMIAFELKGGREAGRKLMNSVEVCVLAVSLGDVDTLIQHPATMTHCGYTPEELEEVGITEGLVRLSVGLEDVDDLIYDLRQAMKRI